MEMRTLGKTGLQVSKMAMGGLFVASFAGPFEQAKATVRRGFELGMNYVDTAPGYADSETVFGKIFAETGRPKVLSTKFGGFPQPFLPKNRECLMKSFETSLRLLRADYIDVLFIHEPDRPAQYDWWDDLINYDGPVMEVLETLKASGAVRNIGLGGTTVSEMLHIVNTGKFDVLLTAFNYSLLWREAERLLIPAAKALGMGIVAGSPLQQGALSTRYDDVIKNGARWLSPHRQDQYRKLYGLLDETGMDIAEMGMRFVAGNPDISCVLTGARSPAELEVNYKAVEKGPLPPDVLRRLDEIAAMVPFRPFEEPFSMPFGSQYRGPGIA
jgi:aryl-alcohol dehydrogenase-like predicted oxidoreductase